MTKVNIGLGGMFCIFLKNRKVVLFKFVFKDSQI